MSRFFIAVEMKISAPKIWLDTKSHLKILKNGGIDAF
jgi:hypothetical protein